MWVDYEFIPLEEASSEPCEWIFEDSFEEIEDEFDVFERLEYHFEILIADDLLT